MLFIGRRCYWLSLLLCTCMLGQISLYNARANDRSADIIGTSSLLVPAIITPSGLSGKGQMVGIADSGLDKGSMTDIHPDLQTEAGTKPKVILQSYTDRTLADDPDGHGTFMAATIAGTGQASEGKYQGIAPGATLYFQALLDTNNSLKIPDNINYLFTPAYSAGVRIHVDGWGGGTNTYSTSTADIDRFIYWHPDFLPVFSAGNSGPGSGTLTTQANSKNSLVVGSSQVPRPAFDPESNYADQAAESSSMGPAGDGRIKPDLLAPGSALISACSSLVESNFAANSYYTRMGGSSMSAAVTGGALALLREQLSSQFNLNSPSSALLKALLINGARSVEGDISRQGYGILDSAGTALALKEGTFKFIDGNNRMKTGDASEFKLQVSDPSMPLKVTLAWVDPPAETGSAQNLVNNLDLVVQDPDGKIYYGNDFNSQGKVDVSNNVEQVTIKAPEAGEYTISVRAGKINYGTGQDFALVYGQSLKTGVIQSSVGNDLLLGDESTVNLGNRSVQQVIDRKLADPGTGIQVGSEIYLSSAAAYIFGTTWETGGIQALQTADGDLLLEMNRQVRDGGYYLDPAAGAAVGSITVNGQVVAGIEDIPTGSELKADVNPFLQTIWKLEAFNLTVSGYIDQVNPVTRELTLLNNGTVYKLAPWAAISYQDQILDCTDQDTPYGSVQTNDLENLLPGTKVTMQVSSQSRAVQAMTLERSMAVGRVAEVTPGSSKILLDTGKTYLFFPGTSIFRDQILSELSDIQIGDRVMAILLPDSPTIIQIQAFSDVTYGRVVYSSPQKRTIYLIDSSNRSHIYSFDSKTEVFGYGIPLETASITAGSWVRVISDPTGATAWRVDLAEVLEETEKTVISFDYSHHTMKMSDGSEYSYNAATRISKGGYSMNIEDIVPGENVELTTLLAVSPWEPLLAGVEVTVPDDIEPPQLSVTARSLNGVLVIQGYTSANLVYLYRQDGSRERIEVTDGHFDHLYKLLDNETNLSAVALDTKSGSMKDININVGAFTAETTPAIFNDISGHWAEQYIVKLAQRNAIKGYEDGTFRPDQTVTRAELMVMIAQLQNIDLNEALNKQYFTDYRDIPWWARPAVMAARTKGWVCGYPDGSFRPNQAVTRSELAVIYANINDQGLVNLFPGETIQPQRAVTRAEVAAVLARL